MDIQSHQVTFDRAAHLKKTEVDPKEDQMNSPVLYGQPQSAFQLFCVKNGCVRGSTEQEVQVIRWEIKR